MTSQDLGRASGGVSPPSTAPFDPSPEREKIRGYIALGLVILLAIVVLVPLIALVICREIDGQLEKVIQLLMSPLVGIVGAVIGFYFGGRDKS